MATVTLGGKETNTSGSLPERGSKAPPFTLVAQDMSDRTLADFAGRKKVLSIVPSLETGVCAASARRFNEEASSLEDTVVLNISADLPLAAARFCESEGLSDVIPLSTFRNASFGDDYGIRLVDGPWAGLNSRAVVVLDREDTVVYTQLVPEIGQEPDYGPILEALRSA